MKDDGFVKSQKNPSPSMGEGWGEGEKGSDSSSYIPLPFIPSHKGRGNGTFYEFVKDKEFIKFLGTAGARFVMAKQLRSSAGVYLRIKGKSIILDPGPGTLVRCAKSRPPIDVTKLDAVILTHAHIDHSNDVNVLIDAMTGGGLERRGILFAPSQCLDGANAVVLPYLRGFVQDIGILKPHHTYRIDDLTFATSSQHQHPVETYGVMFQHHGKKISFMVDTKYFPGLVKDYEGSHVLIMNVVRFKPHESGEVMHLSIDDVKEILSRIRPETAILTHFGMTMLRAKPREVASRLSDELQLEVIAASDGMTVEL
jgi:phosphoribosyl 1,2-cyclic phosphodiesterase